MGCEYLTYPAHPIGMTIASDSEARLPEVESSTRATTRWFSPIGGVHYAQDAVRVYVGDTLIGEFEPDDVVERDLVLTALAGDPKVHLGRLAAAFDISSEMLRRIRRIRQTAGIKALVVRGRRGTKPRLSEKQQSKIEAKFEAGVSIDGVLVVEGRRWKASRATIGRVHKAWTSRRAASAQPAVPSEDVATTRDPELPFAQPPQMSVAESLDAGAPGEAAAAPEQAEPRAADSTEARELSTSSVVSAGPVKEEKGSDDDIAAGEVRSCAVMQHAGTWLLIAMAARLGLHAAAEAFGEDRVLRSALRIALDACIAALAIGEKCIEGVRRLATPSGGALMRADHPPAATWVRRVLGAFAAAGGAAQFHLRMLGNYLRAHERGDEQEPEVLYVDNHLRPYTGKAVIRRGWRMKDKRVVPGCTDFYVHDGEGSPVYRFTSPAHASLTEHLAPVARLLRLALGDAQKILLVFDRGGSFPTAMATLRDEGFEFVTYERKPYALFASAEFTETITIDAEQYGIYEDRKRNLRNKLGRVRRLAVRTPEGRQINLLAVSEQPAEWLVAKMFGRWVQENSFKHGVERWGINQLDGRTTQHYPPDAIIPNPAHRRLTNARRIAQVREGDARRELARLKKEDPKRAKYQRAIDEAIEEQDAIAARLPAAPKHTRLADSELAGTLVHHTVEYKLAIDTVRIACANAEADFAATLAPHMRQPGQAKRALRNLFLAPGRVRVNERSIAIELMPACTRSERAALQRLLATVNTWQLKLPGDAAARRLVFKAQLA